MEEEPAPKLSTTRPANIPESSRGSHFPRAYCAAKGPGQIIVIDHIEKPSDN